jgi:hypothetical protein
VWTRVTRAVLAVIGGVLILLALVALLLAWGIWHAHGGIGAERLVSPIVGVIGLALLAAGAYFIVMACLSTETLMGKGYTGWRSSGYMWSSRKPDGASGRELIQGERFEPEADRPRDLH